MRGAGCKRREFFLVAVTLLVALVYAWYGPGGATLPELLAGRAPRVVLEMRLARLAAAWSTGVVLASSGLLLQYSLRNPLADPYLLGVSPAALLAVTLAALLAPSVAGFYASVALVSIAGGLLGLVLVLLASRLGVDTYTTILAGVAVSTMLSGASYALGYLAAAKLGWPPSHALFGGFAGIVPEHAVVLLVDSAVSLASLLLMARGMEALLYGDDAAVLVGVEPRRARLAALLAAGLPVAVATGYAGVIGFVGLIAPNVARRLVGCVEARRVAVTAALVGGLVTLAADEAARLLGPVTGLGELPAGALIAILGGVFLAAMLTGKW